MADFLDKAVRSFRLIGASTRVLNDDGELLALPILSGVVTLALGGALVWIGMTTGAFDAIQEGQTGAVLDDGFYLWLFGFYIVQYCVIHFFNTALVGAALQRLDGGDPTIGSALKLALARLPQIVGFAIVSATVGLVLNFIQERLGLLGRILSGVLGFAWAVTTFLVIPVIAAEGLGPVRAIERSTELLRKTWGENLVGTVGINFIIGIAGAVVALVGMGGAAWLIQNGNMVVGAPAFVAAFCVLLGIWVFGAALSAVYSAAVYYYAVVGEPPAGFDSDTIRGAFATRPESS